jgi:hypothetical protein
VKTLKDVKVGEVVLWIGDYELTRIQPVGNFNCVLRGIDAEENCFTLVGVGEGTIIFDWFEDIGEQPTDFCMCDLYTVIMAIGCQCGGK